jgi:hypothetical protein
MMGSSNLEPGARKGEPATSSNRMWKGSWRATELLECKTSASNARYLVKAIDDGVSTGTTREKEHTGRELFV